MVLEDSGLLSVVAPSRLILSLPSTTALLSHLITPPTSPTLTLLTVHPPHLIAHLAQTYLTSPPSTGTLDHPSDPAGLRFWGILNASDGPGSAGWAGAQAGDLKGKGRARGDGLVRFLAGEDEPTSLDVVVQVLVRKQQGGANKGMSRSLEGLRVGKEGNMVPCAWHDVEGLQDTGKTYTQPETEAVPEQEVRPPCFLFGIFG